MKKNFGKGKVEGKELTGKGFRAISLFLDGMGETVPFVISEVESNNVTVGRRS